MGVLQKRQIGWVVLAVTGLVMEHLAGKAFQLPAVWFNLAIHEPGAKPWHGFDQRMVCSGFDGIAPERHAGDRLASHRLEQHSHTAEPGIESQFKAIKHGRVRPA
jgi:hypothetical protein